MFAKKMWVKKRKTAFKKHPIRQSGKKSPSLNAAELIFAGPVLICRKSAKAGSRQQRFKEMSQFVEQGSCLAQTSVNNETFKSHQLYDRRKKQRQ